MHKWVKIQDFALDNYGLVTTSQAAALNVSPAELSRWTRIGRLEKRAYGVFRLASRTPTDFDRYAEALAIVGNDSQIFGESVLAIHNLAMVNPAKIEVATQKRIRRCIPQWIKIVSLPLAGESEIFADINDQIIRQAESIGFSCECEGTTANNEETRSMMALSSMQSYIAKKVDGIFFAPFERVRNIDAVNKAVCDLARQAHIPMVLIDRDIVAPPLRRSFDLVSLDNTTAASLMAHHMIAAGCRNIYFFANSHSAYSVNIRQRAVKITVIEAGFDFYDQSYICGDPKDMNVVRNIPIIRRQTGIICANYATAAILMSSLAE